MIKEYDVVVKGVPENVDEYEELTVRDFLARECASEDESLNFIHTYNAINMHHVISSETLDRCLETLEDIKTDERLKGLNCIVLLSLKQKGRGTTFKQLTQDEFNKVVLRCNELKINYGFDSCSANKFADVVINSDAFQNKTELLTVTESCESSCFSSYVNVNGYFSPCSFIDKTEGWEKGIDVINCVDFMKDVWYSEPVIKWRNHLLTSLDENGQRTCPVYKI